MVMNNTMKSTYMKLSFSIHDNKPQHYCDRRISIITHACSYNSSRYRWLVNVTYVANIALGRASCYVYIAT